MRWLAYLHPALMIVALTLGLVVLREGLRIRRARFFRHEIDSSLHRRLGRIFVALIVLGFGAGLVSMAWLRQKALFESVHSRLATGVLVSLLLAAAFGLWLERSEDDRVRGVHLSFAAVGLLLALTAAVAGFAILP